MESKTGHRRASVHQGAEGSGGASRPRGAQGDRPGRRCGAACARQLGYGVESVRTWVKQADIDNGAKPGVSTVEQERIRRLEQENRELRRANEMAGSTGGATTCA